MGRWLVTWLRNLARRYGPIGLAIAGAGLLLLWLWRRAPILLIALLTAAALVLFFSLQPVPVNAAPSYRITDLGTLPRGTFALPTGLNNRGDLAGYADTGDESEDGDPVIHAVRWVGGRIEDLGGFGGSLSWATDINDRGVIALNAQTGPREFSAYLWEGGATTALPGAGGGFTIVSALNNRGQAAGAALWPGDSNVHAAAWEGGALRELGFRGKSLASDAAAMNDSGDIAGTRAISQREISPYRLRDRSVVDLPGVGVPIAIALAINSRGDAAGAAWPDAGNLRKYHAVVWRGTRVRDLGTLGGDSSVAAAVCDSGQVVGAAQSRDRRWHATLWENGHAVDLEQRISRATGWKLLAAAAINRRGQVAGIGMRGSQPRAFLLTPQ